MSRPLNAAYASRSNFILASRASQAMFARGIGLYQILDIPCDERGRQDRSSEAPPNPGRSAVHFARPRSARDARRRSCGALSCTDKGARSGRSDETLRVFLKTSCSTDWPGGCPFEVTICDLKRKARARWASLPPIRFHRTWRCDALERAPKSTRDRRQHRDHAHLRSPPSNIALA